MPSPKLYLVSELAARTGVSVRTLHHYDAIGLLTPRERSAKGYRLYGDAELLRLQQILIERSLGLSLEHIRRTLDDPSFDLQTALIDQRERLYHRRDETAAMIEAVDAALASLDDDERGDAELELERLFEGFDPAAYEAEVEQRWGQTQAYAESKRRTQDYGPEQWAAIKAEAGTINRELAALMVAEVSAADPRAMDLAERHREHIGRWFYACPPTLHAGLGQMYVDDPRFAATYDEVAPGLAAYVRDAIVANAARQG